MTIRRSALFLVLLLGAGLMTVAPAQGATLSGACNGTASGDFNADFFDDLAVGVPNEDAGSVNNAGGVDVHYGSDIGLSEDEVDAQFWGQGTSGVPGVDEAGDQFGACVAAGDFNGDSFDDLAISSPGEALRSSRGNFANTGAVTILRGSDNGLVAAGAQLFHQDVAKVAGKNEKDDEWGSALAAGDFDGDESDDLAVGAPFEDIEPRGNAGAVTVLYGRSTGLSGSGSQGLYQNVRGVAGSSEGGDQFGRSLATGDIDGSGRDDLVIGIPGEDVGRALGTGAIHTFLGTNNGLTVSRDRIWHQDAAGVIGSSEGDDQFGYAVTVGDYSGDGFEDVAVGVPSEDVVDPDVDEGVVQIFYGTETGPTAAADQMFDASDFGGATEDLARFGNALNSGDVDEDGTDDLYVGAPLEDAGAVVETDAGAVYYAHGVDGAGIDETTALSFSQDDTGDLAEEDDFFGTAIIAGNYDGATGADLAAGAPGQDDADDDIGAVGVIYSDGAVLDDTTGQHITQADGADDEEDGDAFGSALG